MACFKDCVQLNLLHLSSVKIAIYLWSNNDYLSEFRFLSTNCGEMQIEWQAIEEKIIKKVSQLFLPDVLKVKIVKFIRPIGLQIYKWKESQRKRISDEADFLRMSISHICWTPQGTVNAKETAKRIICYDKIKPEAGYRLACTYCLENEIASIWKSIPIEFKRSYFYIYKFQYIPNLIDFWTLVMTKKVNKIEELEDHTSIWGYAFTIAFQSHKIAAIEFFWAKLTAEEKSKYWLIALHSFQASVEDFSSCTFFHRHYFADSICFLFSQVEEMQKARLNMGVCPMPLKYFLEWPYQSAFMKIAIHFVSTDAEFYYDNVFYKLIHKIEHGFQDYEYQTLFKDFWHICPTSYKSYSSNVITLPGLIPKLFQVKSQEILSFLFRNLTTAELDHLVSLHWSTVVSKTLARNNDWQLFKFFILECFKSEKKLTQFRDMFFQSMSKNSRFSSVTKATFNANKDIDAKIYFFITEFLQNFYKKRHVGDSDSLIKKRVCHKYSLRNQRK